jgi:hypothetical protein
MNNNDARRRIGRVQGNLMRLVAQLESCKLILIGAGAPDLGTVYTDTKSEKKVQE